MLETSNDTTIKPVCFVIMPYGIKPTFAETGKPTNINYDALWDKALLPLIEEDLGYDAVRADQDMGAMIIKEMIERLALADLVIADVSTPNANVYYEIGIRHAAKDRGCVLISTDWSKQSFDLNQIRQLRYPLPEGNITDDTGKDVREKLKATIPAMIEGTTPVYECIPGYPNRIDANKVASFRKYVDSLSEFSREIRAIKLMPKDQRDAPTKQLLDKYKKIAGILPSIAVEIIYLLRDNTNWENVVVFIDTLPNAVKSIPLIQEQRCLALSKDKNKHLEAIAALNELIFKFGDTSERRGLIGGRYKKLFRDTKDTQYLNKAIDAYEQGMQLDLNDYYPSSNLARLYRTRARKGDEEKAKTAAAVTVYACERARKLNPADEWILPTLLAAAFDAGDIDKAQELYDEMAADGIQPFKLDGTIPDLENAVQLQKDQSTIDQLNTLLADIQKLNTTKPAS